MLSLLKKLFACKLISIKSLSTLDQEPKPTSGTAADKTPVAQSCPQTVPIVGTNQNTLQVPASEFAKCASIGPACSRLQISDIPQVITQLNAQLERLNISPDAFDDFYGNSLLGVCPICNEYCAGRGLCRMPLLAAAGDNVRFTGNSGGFERMMQGKCLDLLYFRGQCEKSYLQSKGDIKHDTDRQPESQTVQQRVQGRCC